MAFPLADVLSFRRESAETSGTYKALAPMPLSAMKEHILAKIRAKESDIARIAGEIRYLRMELETEL